MLTAFTPPPTARPDGWHATCLAFTRGKPAVLLDQGGAVLAFAAAAATSDQLHFAIQQSSGLIHAAMTGSRLDQLQIPDQWVSPSENSGCGFAVAVDAAEGITTGISARDRARTLQVLADPATTPADVARPGHVMPIRCSDNGFATHQRPWELAVDLVAASGHSPVAVVCRLIGDDGDTLDADGAVAFAATHGLPVCEPPVPRRYLHVAGVRRG
jgi:3,4-dihydroxy-2-butanone 4-phosphate synthase